MGPKMRLMLTIVLVLSTFLVLTQAASADWFYVVKAGDTLFAIGRRYGVNAYEIARYNHLANPNLIYVGQKLRILFAGEQHPAPSVPHGPAQPGAPITPTAPSAPASWPVALCWDGSYSYSLELRWTCSGHGGVQVWMNGAGWYYVPKYFEAPAPAVPPPVASCECSSDLFDCEDFASPAVAQACFEHCRAVIGRDVHWLDRDGDGLACELTTTPAQ